MGESIVIQQEKTPISNTKIKTATNNSSALLSTHFEGIGWKVKLQQKRTNYFLTLAKEIVVGNALKKGDEVYYYVVDCEGRKALLVFLDGKERPMEQFVQLRKITFFIK